jgi:beta-N-acetylglucosaminidase
MKQVSEKAQMLKEEREKRQIIANQKKAYYESLRQKRIEQENDDSEDSDEEEKPVRFNDLIQEMMKKKEEIEKVTLPQKPSPVEATMKFLSTFQVRFINTRKRRFC